MAQQWEHDMAAAFEETKSKIIEPCIGIVVEVEPFKATIRGGAFVLTRRNTFICQSAIQKAYEFDSASGTLNGEGFTARGVVTLADVLEVGNQILVIPIHHGQKFVVVDVLAGGWL